MEPARAALLAAGLYHVAFAAFHLGFWKLFRWRGELARLGGINRAVMQILNLCLTFVFVVFAVLIFVFPQEMTGTGLGRALLWAISAFWLLRAVEQVVFFGLRSILSSIFFVVFVVGALLPVIALAAQQGR
jgi:hypothetical protein